MALDENAMEIQDGIEDDSRNEEKIINEEYKVWKKNAPYLYDLVVTHALEWPTLTVQWLPDIETPENKEYSVQRLILGTHTSDGEQNYLQIATVQLPNNPKEAEAKMVSGEDEIGRYGGAECRINVSHRINHDGEVNRARYMPQNPCLIATKTVKGEVYVFDYTKHPSKPSTDGKCHPDLRLKGPKGEGYGLEWNTKKKGYILACGEEEEISLWDISAATKENKEMSTLQTFQGHEGIVGDISWNYGDENVFVSGGDDRHLFFWDIRQKDPLFKVDAHKSEINCVDFNPKQTTVLASGSSDHTVALWDMRNLKTKLHSLEHHTDEIFQIQWSPTHDYIVASASSDRRINIWDLSRIGEEQEPEEAEDGPPELLFVHGGHTNKISDFSWNPALPWTLCSAAEDNICQVWRMVSSIYSDDAIEVRDSDVE